jgi:hypothetical protein
VGNLQKPRLRPAPVKIPYCKTVKIRFRFVITLFLEKLRNEKWLFPHNLMTFLVNPISGDRNKSDSVNNWAKL